MGARQVGKTWLMRQFGRCNFQTVHYFDFHEKPLLASFFELSKSPRDLLPKLAVLSGRRIDLDHDLIIFDEIQDCNEALNSLKYFNQDCPQLAVMAAGSLLGVKINGERNAEGSRPKSYPVGKVDILNVEPLDFVEFLRARDDALYVYYMSISGEAPLPEIFHEKLKDALKEYLVVGGMPEAVASYLKHGDVGAVRKIQRDLIVMQEDDVVKYNGKIDAAKILLVLRSLVPQLAKSNEKFLYDVVRAGARARGYEEAIEWLVSARMVRRINNVGEIRYPLSAYEMRNAFKLFSLDVGLLRELAGVTPESLMLEEDFQFKGPFMENYVLQQLFGKTEGTVKYWAARAEREIDFVLQRGNEVIPVEVKGGEDKKAASFKEFVRVRKPLNAIRFSMRNLRRDGGFINIPLYLAPRYEACLRGKDARVPKETIK